MKTDTLESHSKNILTWEILEIYGYPQTAEACLSKSEKLMYVYGYSCVLFAIKKHDVAAKKSMNGEMTAMEFCKDYYEKYGYHAIPTEQEIEETTALPLLKGLITKPTKNQQEKTKK